MNDTIFFQDDSGLLVADHQYSDGIQTLDVHTIEDFDIVITRAMDSLSISLSEGIKLGTSRYQLQLISSFGRKPSWIPVEPTSIKDLRKLRSLAMALSKVIARRRHEVGIDRDPVPDAGQSLPASQITCLNLPGPLERMEAVVMTMMQEPEDTHEDLSRRFLDHITSELPAPSAISLHDQAVTLKVCYEYKRKHGDLSFPISRRLSGLGFTVGQVFRPLSQSEVPSFQAFVRQFTGTPSP